MEIPIGLDGLYGSRNPAALPPTALTVADNLTYIDNTMRKEGGASKYNATPISGAPRILAGFDWWPTVTDQRSVILTSSGTLLKDSGTGTYPVTLKTGLTTASGLGLLVAGGKEAAAGNRKLFCFTGSDPVQVLSGDGVTTSNISAPPADWAGTNQPVGGVIHQSRLFGYGNLNDPHRLYYSDVTNHEMVSNTFSIYPGVGERILAAFSLRGFLIVFKFPQGVFLLDTRDPSQVNWRPDKISDEVGICGIGAAVLAERSIIFMDATGNLEIVQQVTQDGFEVVPLGQAQQIKSFINENVDLKNLALAKCIYAPKDREIHFALPGITGSGINTRRLVLDVNLERNRFRFSTRDRPVSLWTRKISNVLSPVMGDDSGTVWDLGIDARSKDGLGYEVIFQTAPTDFTYADPSLRSRRKNFKFLEIYYEETGNHDLAIDVFLDDMYEDTYLFSMIGSSGFIIGTSLIGGPDLIGGGNRITVQRRRITGSGKRFHLRGRNAGAGQDIRLARVVVYFSRADERLNI